MVLPLCHDNLLSDATLPQPHYLIHWSRKPGVLYSRLDGHHIQFNVVDAETLRKAQAKPEEYQNLIVRVAGYSDYFVDLGKDLQNEIIARTEQKAF